LRYSFSEGSVCVSNELRLIRLRDFNLADGTVLVHGKGNKQVVLPLGFEQLRKDLEVYLVGRNLDEYLIHRTRIVEQPFEPMNPASIPPLVQDASTPCRASRDGQDPRVAPLGR
jgi:site-specific recombinase XerD